MRVQIMWGKKRTIDKWQVVNALVELGPDGPYDIGKFLIHVGYPYKIEFYIVGNEQKFFVGTWRNETYDQFLERMTREYSDAVADAIEDCIKHLLRDAEAKLKAVTKAREKTEEEARLVRKEQILKLLSDKILNDIQGKKGKKESK